MRGNHRSGWRTTSCHAQLYVAETHQGLLQIYNTLHSAVTN